MCYSHYGSWHREQHGRASEYYRITCIMCGAEHDASRRDGKFCSDICKGQHYSQTRRTKSKLPDEHPVMQRIAAEKDALRLARQQAKRSNYEWRTPRECPGCACWFTPLYTPSAVMCSRRCQRRVHRWRRKAAERGAAGTFTWSEFMRIARKFDYRCAYCGVKPERLDPDHVVPLSRGGSNAPSNLLPSCTPCNSHKGAMTLPEWEAWRRAKRMAPRVTYWDPADQRFTHLTDAALLAAA